MVVAQSFLLGLLVPVIILAALMYLMSQTARFIRGSLCDCAAEIEKNVLYVYCMMLIWRHLKYLDLKRFLEKKKKVSCVTVTSPLFTFT